jgi:SPP1 gp7 family putative phage head morphogenesis protein
MPVSYSNVEAQYRRDLLRVAKEIERYINAHDPADPFTPERVTRGLAQYAEFLTPWAQQTAGRVVRVTARRSLEEWSTLTARMGKALARDLASAAIGEAINAAQAENVKLITSLPTQAAERVQRLAMQARLDGSRAAELYAEVSQTGKITAARARLIARTEVGRTATELTKARAASVGSEGYVWRTSEDGDVRESHADMQGRFVRWDDPPTLDGLTGHAGALPNCRCYPEPVL